MTNAAWARKQRAHELYTIANAILRHSDDPRLRVRARLMRGAARGMLREARQ
jgi:hypothetical protein